MKLVSWNVNGLRACIQKGFLEQFDQFDADFFCLQETKLSEGQLQLDLPGYEQYWCYAEKKGYSGTAIFTKHTPQSVHYGLDVPELDNEGRLITLEYPEFYLVTCYTPNAQRGLARIDHRMTWDEAFRAYLQKLDAVKPVIVCGDLNVAHKEIDLKNPTANRGNAGFSDQERDSFQKTLDLGFTDTFRHLHPDKTGAYSWWSYMFHARENNAGWRIDYFLVSDRLKDAIYRANIHSEVLGSDHCPVSVDLGLICNGGIWSPMSQGSARQILPESEEKSNDEKKASAVSAKALIAFAAIFVVILCGVLLWEPPVTDGEYAQDPAITVQIFQEPLMIFEDPYNSNYNPNYNKLSDKDTIYYCPIGIDETTLKATNYWFRVSVSPALLSETDGSAKSIAIEEVDSAPNTVYNVYFRDYFTDEKYSEFGGWLVYGSLNRTTTFHLTVTIGEETYHQTIVLTPLLNDIPTIENAFTVTTFEDPVSCGISASSDSRISRIINETYSFDAYVKDLYLNRELSQWNSWFFVELSDEAAELLQDLQLEVHPMLLLYGLEQVNQQLLFVSEAYSDMSCTDFIGWFIFGDLEPSTNLVFTLRAKNQPSSLIDTKTIPSAPYLSPDVAMELSTEELFHFAMDHRGITGFLEENALSATIVDDLCRKYPFFDVLYNRTDAISTLMNCSHTTSNDKEFATLLLERCFYYFMTPQQQADFLTGKYSNYPYDSTEGWIDPIDTTDLKIIDILQLAMTADDSCDLFLRCTNSEAAYRVFEYRKTLNGYLLDLANRPDVVSELISLYESTDDAFYLHLKVFFVYLQNRTQSTNMTTSELVDDILADEQLCREITMYDQETLEIVSRDEPMLQTLLERSDAVDVLLNCTPTEDFAKWVPTHLLISLFADKMTAQQTALLVTGLYNSSPAAFDFTLDSYDPTQYSTPLIVNTLSRSTDLFQYFNSAQGYHPLEVIYEIYQLLRPYSNLLQELETRPDAIAALRVHLASNPSDASSVKFLLALYENYPQIFGGDEDDEYRYTLTHLPVSGWIENQSPIVDFSYFTNSFPFLYSDGIQDGPLVQDSTFAYLISPPTEWLANYTPDQLTLESTLVYTTSNIPDADYVTVRPCYADSGCTQLVGWLVYGNVQTDNSLLLSLSVGATEVIAYYNIWLTVAGEAVIPE